MSEVKKVMLIIMDGWGLSPIPEGNAPLIAETPVLDYAYATYPKAAISASGLEVGLNRGEMGNSEVGHLNLGTGRVVWESLPRIDYSMEGGSFGENQELLKFFEKAKESGRLHLIGLVSSGGVHSHIRHLEPILRAARENKISNVFIHFISDGRDTPPDRGPGFADQLDEIIHKSKKGSVATVIGRYFAMDRDNRWDRVKQAYDLFVNGVGEKKRNAKEAIEASYKEGKGDEFVSPSIIDEDGLVKSGDSILFYNFRADRMRQLISAFLDSDFKGFEREKLEDLNVITMTEYDKKFNLPVIFQPIDLKETIADVYQEKKIKQFHVAETEKYPHVTYFFNGGVENPHNGETQVVVPSPKVATYDQKPEMSAAGVTEKVIEAVKRGDDFIVVNYANGDMVGHTGVLKAGIVACETVDKCLGKVFEVASKMSYDVMVTADHGNCELMIDPATGQPLTEHTTSPVPFVYLNFGQKPFLPDSGYSFSRDNLIEYSTSPVVGVLSDVAPSILSIQGVPIPDEMGGTNLISMI